MGGIGRSKQSETINGCSMSCGGSVWSVKVDYIWCASIEAYQSADTGSHLSHGRCQWCHILIDDMILVKYYLIGGGIDSHFFVKDTAWPWKYKILFVQSKYVTQNCLCSLTTFCLVESFIRVHQKYLCYLRYLWGWIKCIFVGESSWVASTLWVKVLFSLVLMVCLEGIIC